MKRLLALLLCLAALTGLAACGGGEEPAPQGGGETPAVESPAPETEPAAETPAEETPEAPEAEFLDVNTGDTISLDFVEITMGEAANGPEMSEGYSSYIPSNESNQFFWVTATLMNTSGNAFPLYNMSVRLSFDDKYNYEGDVRCFTAVDMDPLVENKIYIYAEVPSTLIDMYQTATVQFGFNDEFGDYDYEANNYELALENYDHLYQFTYTKPAA